MLSLVSCSDLFLSSYSRLHESKSTPLSLFKLIADGNCHVVSKINPWLLPPSNASEENGTKQAAKTK